MSNNLQNITRFVNLTPHDIVYQGVDGTRITFPKSGKIAKILNNNSSPKTFATVNGIPIVSRSNFEGSIDGLPDPTPNTIYIVSAPVRAILEARGIVRRDVVSPGTGPEDEPIRENGQIVAVTRFVTNS
ncbi:MAG: hypothetical protein NZZ41_05520 [Candidatus Dojkabacteria bacterium]|nr:hypothetical protein [Candidatus Dojkabacteria bacterium]